LIGIRKVTMARPLEVPEAISRLGLLDRVDYQDAFTARSQARHTAREWARLGLEGPPLPVRMLIYRAQRLGFRLGPFTSAEHLGGWAILRTDPQLIVLGAAGPLFTARVVVSTSPGQIVLSTLLRYEQPAARLAWSVLRFGHRLTAPYLLSHAVARAAQEPAGP
jgi:hypothetical protein